MKLDTFFSPETGLKKIPDLARKAEKFGFDGIWLAETQHNPFLPGVLVAEHTERIQFGTAIAVSFARSPTTLAHEAWDLADFSDGRFILGLGTQVKAHIERRFGLSWPDSPVEKLREQLGVIRAFWGNWQNDERLNFRGDYYKITLTAPFFRPSSLDVPFPPIYIAGVNTGLARLAGEAADGFHAHPLHTKKYLEQVLIPAIQKGLDKQGRERESFSLVVNAFVVSSPEEKEFVRKQISFYASTPSYRPVFKLHGWGEIAEKLSRMATRQQWDQMPSLIDDRILEAVAVVASEAELPAALHDRYGGIADRLTVYSPFVPGERDAFWHNLVKGIGKV